VPCLLPLLPYWAIEICGPVIPATTGLWVGSAGLAVMVVMAAVVPVAAVTVVFAGYASHAASVITVVRRPVGSMSVAELAATSSTLILHTKKLISGFSSRVMAMVNWSAAINAAGVVMAL
jgi:hypothetical protein